MATNNFLQQVYSGTGLGTFLKDYKHASKIFVSGNYRLAPKMGFLFHVAFDINPAVTRLGGTEILEAGLMVKTAQLPKYTFDTKVMNAYNRPNIVQNKIKYEPIQITFHDDSSDVVRDLWYDHLTYYYRDTDYTPDKYAQSTKYNARQTQDWGFTPAAASKSNNGSDRLLKAIRIYSLHQKKFTEYVLINPTITAWQHGQHQNGQNEPLENSMTVAYETVLYNYGTVVPGANTNFAELHYDNSPSPLGIPNLAADAVSALTGSAGILGFGQTDKIDHQIPGSRTKFANGSSANGLTALLSQIALGVSKGNNPLKNLSVPTLIGYSSIFAAGGGFGSPSGDTPQTNLAAPSNSPVTYQPTGKPAASPGAGATSNGDKVAIFNNGWGEG